MAERRTALAINIQVDGVREMSQAFRRLPKDASVEQRAASMEIASEMAGHIASAARLDSRQSALLAPTVRAVSDRVPAVTVGGSKRLPVASGAKAFEILFGANFGATTYRVRGRVPYFRQHAGKGSDYFIWATVTQHQSVMVGKWMEATERVIDKWAGGPR